ncbi:hypothetical protein I552_5371 [Mycobacterium xenopi 3993]|nr:hypothetical protein I552_5371 [Mycobacterium xenopi 3993]
MLVIAGLRTGGHLWTGGPRETVGPDEGLAAARKSNCPRPARPFSLVSPKSPAAGPGRDHLGHAQPYKEYDA